MRFGIKQRMNSGRDTLGEIGGAIKKNKLRTALTGLSVAWGIFMLVILLASGTGIENGVKREFSNIAANSIWIHQGQTSVPSHGLQPGRPIRFTDVDFENMQKIPGVRHITARYYLGANMVSYKAEHESFTIIACHPDHKHIEKTIVLEGRMINDFDISECRKTAAIGENVKERLFGAESAVGKHITVNGVPFAVVGVVTDEKSERALRTVYLPISTTQKIFGAGNRIHAIIFTTGDASVEKGLAMEREARKKLAVQHKFEIDDEKALRLWNGIEDYQQLMDLFKSIRIFLWVVGVGTIIAGIVGIGNIMMISVAERKREIGIRKALGATPGSVIRLVLAESVLITLFSGYLGLVAGVAAIELLSRYLTAVEMFHNPEIDLTVAGGALAILVLAGIGAGYVPARRAAMITPTEALREE